MKLKYVFTLLCLIFGSKIAADAVFTGNASDGENSLYYNDWNQTVGNRLDTPSEWVGFSRQYGREDDGYSANDGNTYNVGRARVRRHYVPQYVDREIYVPGPEITEEVALDYYN